MTIKCADPLGASLGSAWGQATPDIDKHFIFHSIEDFASLLFFLLHHLFSVLRVIFGNRRAGMMVTDYDNCVALESELANQILETQTGFNLTLLLLSFLEGKMTRDPTRKYSIVNSWGGLAGTLVAAFLFGLFTHARPKCESQGVWGHLVTKRPRSPSPISLVYGFHQA